MTWTLQAWRWRTNIDKSVLGLKCVFKGVEVATSAWFKNRRMCKYDEPSKSTDGAGILLVLGDKPSVSMMPEQIHVLFKMENIPINIELFFVLFPPCVCVCVCVYQESEVTWSQFRPVEFPPICTWTVYPWGIPTPPPGSAPHPAPPSSAPVSCWAAVERSTLLSHENRFFHDGLSLGLVEVRPCPTF